LNSIKSISWL